MQPDTGWSTGQRALLRFLEQQGILTAEPAAPATGRPTNADLFAAFAGAIDQQGLVDLVSHALRIASVDLEGFTPMPDLVALVPVEVARRGEVVPIAQHDGMLELAAANPLDLETVKSVEFTTGLRVRTKIARREDVCRAVSDAYGVPVAPAASAPEAPAAEVAADPVDAAPDEGSTREPDATIETAGWSFEPVTDDPPAPAPDGDGDAPSENGTADEPVFTSGIEWRAVDGDDAGPGWETPEEAAPRIDEAPALGAPVLSIDDDVRALGSFDDVHIRDAEPPARPSVLGGEAERADGRAEPAASPAAGRAAVLVVSRDLSRRVAVREALETNGSPRVFTMRDEGEARAVLGLGGVAVLVVEGGALATDGRPLWEALRGRARATIVWGGRPGAGDVMSLDRDTDAADVAARVRALLEEAVDG